MSKRTVPFDTPEIYVVQWLLIGLLSPVLAAVQSFRINMLLGAVVLVASYFGGKWLKKTNLVKV